MNIHYEILQFTRYALEKSAANESKGLCFVDDMAEFTRRDDAESTLRSITADLAGWEKGKGPHQFKIIPVTRYVLHRVAGDETGAGRANICEFKSRSEAFDMLKTLRGGEASEDTKALIKRDIWLSYMKISDDGNFEPRAPRPLAS